MQLNNKYREIMNTLKEMQDLLNAAVEQNGGAAKAIEQCDRMYSCEFRTEAFTLGSYFELNDEIDSDDRQYVIDELFLEIANACYSLKNPSHNSNSGCEYYDERTVDWFKLAFPDFVINSSTQVVGSCNYKGEGDGIVMLFETNKHKPVFVSKSHSFYQANQG